MTAGSLVTGAGERDLLTRPGEEDVAYLWRAASAVTVAEIAEHRRADAGAAAAGTGQ